VAVDQVGVQVPDGLPVEVQSRRDARRPVLHEDLAVRDEVVNDGSPPVGFAVDRQRPLVRVDRFERRGERFAVDRARFVFLGGRVQIVRPDQLAVVRGLDCDHVRAEMAQLTRTQGTCDDLAEIEHPDVGERQVHGHPVAAGLLDLWLRGRHVRHPRRPDRGLPGELRGI